jgi:hypothetical protein
VPPPGRAIIGGGTQLLKRAIVGCPQQCSTALSNNGLRAHPLSVTVSSLALAVKISMRLVPDMLP